MYKKSTYFFSFAFILLASLLSDSTLNATPYVRNPHVSDEVWQMLEPYFLPEDSHQKEALDKLFGKKRLLSSRNSLLKAEFLIISPSNKVIVARHHKLRGFLIKAFLDTQNDDDVYWWKKRCDGARNIQASINQHGFNHLFKVPKKWIYPLPAEPSPKEGHQRRNFILVVEDVEPLNQKRNRKAYRERMTPEILNAFYILLTENSLIDSAYTDNTPFCRDGKMAFLDTEHSFDYTQPVPLTFVGAYLSDEMRTYWEQILLKGGPQ